MGTSFEKIDETLRGLLDMINGMYVTLSVAKMALEDPKINGAWVMEMIDASTKSAVDKGFIAKEETSKYLNMIFGKDSASIREAFELMEKEKQEEIFTAGIDNKYLNNCYEYFKEDNPIKDTDILQEECAELIQAISKYKRGANNGWSQIVEEISHVCTSIGVVCKYLMISEQDINKEIDKKCEKYGFER